MYYYNNYIKVLLVLYQRMSTTCNSKQQKEGKNTHM